MNFSSYRFSVRHIAAAMTTMLMVASAAHADPGAPLPGPVPWTWTVQWDMLLPDTQLTDFSTKLGGKLSGLRNTRFDVGDGKTVQINALAAASATDADVIFTADVDGVLRVPHDVVGNGEPVLGQERHEVDPHDPAALGD